MVPLPRTALLLCPPSRQQVRRAVVVAATGAAIVTSILMLGWGVDLSMTMCAMGGCTEAKDADAGGALLMGGFFVWLITVIAAPRAAGIRPRWYRPCLAPLAAIAVGLGGLWIAQGLGQWFWQVIVFAMLAAYVGVLVPSRDRRVWAAGVVAGGAVAAAASDGFVVPVLVGLAVLSLSELVQPSDEARA